jgi:serine/threonine protein kinase
MASGEPIQAALPSPDGGGGNNIADKRRKRARAVLGKIAFHAVQNIPVAGPFLECAWDVWEAYREAGREEGLNPAQMAEILQLLEQRDAERAVQDVLGAPENQNVTVLIAPVVLDELRHRLEHLPGNLRLLPPQPSGEEDVARVVMGERPRRFNPGDATPDRQYTLERFLGFGGFGEVWAARDVFQGERRAVKFCLDANARDTLRAEFEAVRELYLRLSDRTGLVAYHPSNIHCDPPYLVMELCEDGDLRQFIRGDHQEPLAPSSCLALVAPPLRALAAIHAAGAAHRDVKPANILLGSDKRARLADFGLARLVVERRVDAIVRGSSEGRSARDAGAQAPGSRTFGAGAAGTALYMAPEVKRGRVRADDLDALRRADVYSFGVTLAQLLTGKPDLEGGYLGRKHRQNIPSAIRELVAGCVDPDPDQRFATAKDILIFLREEGLAEEAGVSVSVEKKAIAEAAPASTEAKTPFRPKTLSLEDIRRRVHEGQDRHAAESLARERESLERLEAVQQQLASDLKRDADIEAATRRGELEQASALLREERDRLKKLIDEEKSGDEEQNLSLEA